MPISENARSRPGTRSESDFPSPFNGFRTILALGAHPDDIELGCGGSLASAWHRGCVTYAATLSRCEDEATDENRDQRAEEFRRAAAIIGAKPILFSVPNREFPEHRREIMSIMEQLQNDINPDLVFMTSLEDPHQDHSTLAYAVVRSFRRRESILQYEILRSGSHTFTPNLLVDITDSLEKKIQALREYKSQYGRRAYFDEESFKSLARTRGAQAGCHFAEGFVAYKLLW